MTSYLSTAVTGPRCFDCGASLDSASRNGWATYEHPGEADHTPRVAYMPTHAGPPIPHVVDHDGHLAVYVDRQDGRPWTLLGTTPTHRGAVYPEARERGWLEAITTAREWLAPYGPMPEIETAR